MISPFDFWFFDFITVINAWLEEPAQKIYSLVGMNNTISIGWNYTDSNLPCVHVLTAIAIQVHFFH